LSCRQERRGSGHPGAGPDQGRAGAATPGAETVRKGSAAIPGSGTGTTTPEPRN